MPLYEFNCICGHSFETIVKSYEDANENPAPCPQCGSQQTKRNEIPKRTDFVLKGTGWIKKINPKYHK